jgi:glucan phosphoethanolaminetransferase (alkaline phosphatase superfamily)
MVKKEESIESFMFKYPVFALGFLVLILGAFSRFLFKINLFWLVYVGVAVMFIGLFMGIFGRR